MQPLSAWLYCAQMNAFFRPFRLFLALAVPGLTGCTQIPAPDRITDTAVAQAPYPTLVPFESFQTTPPPSVDPAAALVAAGNTLTNRAQNQQQGQP